MKSYVKVYGPPLLKAIKALEKIAVNMPEVCIWDIHMAASSSFKNQSFSNDEVRSFFYDVGEVPTKRCSTIISKSGQSIGEQDFFFEWFKDPTMNELNNLVEKIDEALTPLGCKYTLTTK
jgi:hypothetical protein